MDYRPECLLPDHVVPRSHVIKLVPNYLDWTTRGHEVVALVAERDGSSITLHAVDIDISRARLRSGSFLDTARAITPDPGNQRVVFDFSADDGEEPCFRAGEPIELELWFTGKIPKSLEGLYRSTYKTSEGEEKTLLATQCEATDARRIFPCFDEPGKKVVIQLTVDVPEELAAVSNTDAVKETLLGNGLRRVEFAPTVVMPTYLFALVVGELDGPPVRITRHGVPVRILATPGKRDKCEFALNLAVGVLEFFTDYYEQSYPGNKLDHIAIPDFGAGAMENLGAIIYRETALLVDKERSSRSAIERVVTVVYHETAHMWFGDLVTMLWWNGLWLNEAFATFMEFVATRNLLPEWHAEEKFLAESLFLGLNADAFRAQQSLEGRVMREDDIHEMFSEISYDKGASVLRMTETFLTPEVFRRGIARYIDRHKYANAETPDLWRALVEESGKPINDVMDSFVLQAGYPVIYATRTEGRTFELFQRRFTYERAEQFDARVWKVPMTILPIGGMPFGYILDERIGEVMLPENGSGLAYFNARQGGFYRVAYELRELRELSASARTEELPVLERMGLCDDMFALSKAGYYPLVSVLENLREFAGENERFVWQTILQRLMRFTTVFRSHVFDSYLLELTKDIQCKLGHRERGEDDVHTKVLRGLIWAARGSIGDPVAVSAAGEAFDEYLREHDSLSPDLRLAVFATVAVSRNDEATHCALVRLHETVDSQEEEQRLRTALCAFRDPALLEKTANYLFSPNVRMQDVYIAMRTLAANPSASGLAWKLLMERWDDAVRMYGSGVLMARVITAALAGASTLEEEADVARFFEEHPMPVAKLAIAQARENMRANAAWSKRDGDFLRVFLGQ